MKKEITIYTNETCPYCKTIKEKLKEENIKFTEKDILKFTDEWNSMSELTGMAQLPTLVFDKEYYIPGRDYFSPEHLISLIKNSKESKFDYSTRSFERIKSLNFNILTAFNKLDTTLRNIENKLNTEENEHKSTS
jgi:glutaredoxin